MTKVKTVYTVEQVYDRNEWFMTEAEAKEHGQAFVVYEKKDFRSLARALSWIAGRRHHADFTSYAKKGNVSWFDVYAVRAGMYRHVARIEPYEGDESDWQGQPLHEVLNGWDG